MEQESLIIPDELLISKIYLFREQKVMLDSQLAELYGIETKRLNEQVNRNLDRFPEVPIVIGIESIRKTVNNQDERVDMIYNYLIKFIKQEQRPRTLIGF